MNKAAVGQLVRDRRLEAKPPTDDELAGYWRNALKAYQDALVTATSLEGRYERAYSAARIAATTVIRANGYRVKSAEGQHYVTFLAARHLSAETSALAEAFLEADQMRSVRHEVEYEYENALDLDTVNAALDLVERVLQESARHLRQLRPDLKQRFRQIRPRRRA